MTTTEMEKIFESVLPEKAYKEIGNHNPVMTQRLAQIHMQWFMMASVSLYDM